MNSKSEINDINFNNILSTWKNDFENSNPYLSEKICESIINDNSKIAPFKLSKLAIAAIITIGFISGYILFAVTEKFAPNNEIVNTDESGTLSKYKSEMYISELKYSEFEQLLTEK